jgi:ribosomal-protein-alanine N-acetyltransferase
MNPLFKTPRLQLRPSMLADLPWVHPLWTHAQIRQFLFDDRVISVDESRTLIEASLAHFEHYGYGLWLVFADANANDVNAKGFDADEAIEVEQPIGFAGALPTEDASSLVPSLIYGIHPNFWRRSYATEAMNAVVDYLLTQLAFQRVIADVDEPNLASIRVLLKLNLVQTKRAIVNHHPLLYFERVSAIPPG